MDKHRYAHTHTHLSLTKFTISWKSIFYVMGQHKIVWTGIHKNMASKRTPALPPTGQQETYLVEFVSDLGDLSD